METKIAEIDKLAIAQWLMSEHHELVETDPDATGVHNPKAEFHAYIDARYSSYSRSHFCYISTILLFMQTHHLKLPSVLSSYLETAEWADLPEDFEGDFHWSMEAIEKAAIDVWQFVRTTQVGEFIDGESLYDKAMEECPRDCGDLGHDFYLTRRGHGAGFWDGDYPKTGDDLSEICRLMRSEGFWIDDNGNGHWH